MIYLVFSLFNIVQFENRGCRSTSSISSAGTGSTSRNGTCFTSSECRSAGGVAAGSCAAGFGVCCVFLVETNGAQINQNCTYIRNPGFPDSYSETNGVQYTVQKCSNSNILCTIFMFIALISYYLDVCHLRLDFETFSILGTGNSQEVNLDDDGVTALPGGGQCLDTFDVTVSTGQRIPQICGQNAGQHSINKSTI